MDQSRLTAGRLLFSYAILTEVEQRWKVRAEADVWSSQLTAGESALQAGGGAHGAPDVRRRRWAFSTRQPLILGE